MAHCKDVEEFHRILECPICIERIKDPRILPCLHSFCEKCIQQHMDEKQKDGSFPCPMCNTKFQVPQDGATGFKLNMYLDTISDLFPEVSDAKCEICKCHGSESQASSMCIDCGEGLCQRCAQMHCFTKASINHKVVSLEDVKNGQHFEEIRRSQRVHCHSHPEKVMEIYCEKCMKPLCLLCAMLEHKEHELKNVEKAATEADDVMRKLLDSWKTVADHSLVMSAERKKVLDNLDQQEEQLIHDAERKFSEFKDEVIQKIDVKKTQSIGHIKEHIASARKQAEIAFNEAKTAEMSFKGTLRYVQNVLESAENIEKLQQFYDIKVRLEKLDFQTLETDVTKPIFKLQPEGFTMPTLAINVMDDFEKERIRVSSFKNVQPPAMTDNIVQTQCFSSLLHEKEVVGCYGLSVNDKWFITTSGDKVKVFDRVSGEFIFEVNQRRHKLKYPVGVTCNEKGEIFVTDDGHHGVVKYNEKGQLMKVSAPDMYSGDFGGVVCHGDQLVVADEGGGRVLISDVDCNIDKVIGKESLGLSAFKAAFVCVDNDGLLVASDCSQNHVYVIDYKQSIIVDTFSEQLYAGPFGVCVDEWGHILVACRDSSQVVLMSGQSKHARVLITIDNVSRPTDLVVTGPGEVAVLEKKTGNVKVFKYANFAV